MSDHDRGPYTPPSDRLAFDPREPVRSGPAPVTLIVSALVLLGLVGGVVFLYRDGFRHKAGPAEAVGEPVADMKTTNAAGAPAAAIVIDKTQADTNAPIAFAPPPEAPLRPAANSATPAPPVVKAAAAPAKPAKPLTIASLADAAVAEKPAAKPPPAAPSAAANPAGATWVQIGALSSPDLAQRAWSDIARLEPGPMKGKGRQVQKVEVNGKTLYRTYITGFADRPSASAFCASVKAAGKDCFVK